MKGNSDDAGSTPETELGFIEKEVRTLASAKDTDCQGEVASVVSSDRTTLGELRQAGCTVVSDVGSPNSNSMIEPLVPVPGPPSSVVIPAPAHKASVVVLAILLWIFGLAWLFFGEVGPLCASVAVAIHVRFPPPLGKLGLVPPDILVNCIWAVNFLFTITCFVLCFVSNSNFDLIFLMFAVLISAAASVRYYRSAQDVLDAFCDLGLSSSELQRGLPRQPFLTYFYNGFYCCFRTSRGLTSGDDKVKTISFIPARCNRKIKVWFLGEQHCSEQRPVLLHIFAGWSSPQAPLLHGLASQGWLVVSANFGTQKWPESVENIKATVKWIMKSKSASRMGADLSRISIAGSGHGGLLACHATMQALKGEIPVEFKSMLLLYPALDPADGAGATLRFPCNVRCFGYTAKESCAGWYFRHFTLRGDSHTWDSALPLHVLESESDGELARKWPPTLVIHGQRDSIAPIESSFAFLTKLAAKQTNGGYTIVWRSRRFPRRCSDALVVLPGCSHRYDAVWSRVAKIARIGACAWLNTNGR